MVVGDVPPSSSDTFVRPSEAARYTASPPGSPPVKAILATSGCAASRAPASWPYPVTVLTTPRGKPASSNKAAKASVEQDACSDGLMTAVFPAAKRSEEQTSELQ